MAREIIDVYTAGDTLPSFDRTAPADKATVLTGFTIRLRMTRSDGTTLIKTITTSLTADGHIDTPTDTPPGFFFLFIASDLIAGKLQRTEIEYDDGSTGIATEGDIFFDVGEAIG